MTVEVDFEVGKTDNTITLTLKTEEPQLLIGKGGSTLSDIQKILGRMLRKKIDPELYLDLDINQYKESRSQYLKEEAREIANRAVLERKEQEFEPMSPYSRRIIHIELSERQDVVTESVGEGEQRRVVVRPV